MACFLHGMEKETLPTVQHLLIAAMLVRGEALAYLALALGRYKYS